MSHVNITHLTPSSVYRYHNDALQDLTLEHKAMIDMMGAQKANGSELHLRITARKITLNKRNTIGHVPVSSTPWCVIVLSIASYLSSAYRKSSAS